MQTPDSPQPAITLFQTLSLGLLVLVVYIFLQSSLLQHFARAQLGDAADAKAMTDAMKSLVYDARVLSYLEIISGTLTTLFIVLLVHLRNVSPVEHLKLYRFQKRDLLSWLAVLAAFTILLALVSSVLSPESSDFMQRIWDSTDNIILLIIAIVIVAPIFEETLFRGFLFTGIQQSHLGTGVAIGFTSATWAIIHTQYGAFDLISIFILGIVLSASRIASGSLLVPIILHGTFNFFAILEMAMFS